MDAYGGWIIDGFTAGRELIVGDMANDTRFAQSERDAHLALQIGAEVALPLVKNGQLVAMMVVHAATQRAWSDVDLALLREVSELTWSTVERARAEEALYDADVQKDKFLAVLSHELRNGLAPLVYNAELAEKLPADHTLRQELNARTSRQLRHVVRLVDDLLDVARINTGKIELKVEVLKVREFVNLALDACRPDIERRRHRLAIVQEADSELIVRGDRVRLTQVMSNLLSNAAKYTDQAGTVSVRIAREGDQALIEVSDSGIGIPPRALAQVFDLFTQVRNQQAYSEGGLGIGLSLVKRLVEMHGGSVSASSDGPGRGSTFSVRLPMTTPSGRDPVRQEAGAVSAPAAAMLHVLVVDDQRDAADSLALLLGLYGHHVEVAYTGQQALESAHRRRPDLVLLDLSMPGMDGFAMARRLREQFPGEPRLRIVALTGWGQESDRQRTEAASFDGHLTKPAGSAELEAVLAAPR